MPLIHVEDSGVQVDNVCVCTCAGQVAILADKLWLRLAFRSHSG